MHVDGRREDGDLVPQPTALAALIVAAAQKGGSSG